MTLLGLGRWWGWRTQWRFPLLNPNWFGSVGTPPTQFKRLLSGGDLLKRLASKSYPVSGLGMTMASFLIVVEDTFRMLFLFEDWRWTHWEFSFQVMFGMGLADEPPTFFIDFWGGEVELVSKITMFFEVKVLLQRKTQKSSFKLLPARTPADSNYLERQVSYFLRQLYP